MVKDGSGNLVSHLLHEARGSRYKDVNDECFTQIEDKKKNILFNNNDNNKNNIPLQNIITEGEYHGKYPHTGKIIQTLYLDGTYSNLTPTGRVFILGHNTGGTRTRFFPQQVISLVD